LKHEESEKHVSNFVDISLLAKVNIAALIGLGYKL